MKSSVLAIVTTVISAALIAVFSLWLARSQPHVKYTLSEQIPVLGAVGANGTELVQYLEVKNVGNATAEAIRVRLKGKVTTTRIEPYAQTDKPQAFSSEGSYELVYPSLPPDGSFRLIFASPESGVPQDRISVQHSRGSAEAALAPRSSSVLSWLWIVIPPLIYFVLSMASARSLAAQTYASTLATKPIDVIIQSPKPFYLSHRKWSSIVKDCLRDAASDASTYSQFAKLRAHDVLAAERSQLVTEGEWREIVGRAESAINDWVTRRAINLSDLEFNALLLAVKPTGASNEGWAKIAAVISETFVLRARRRGAHQIDDAVARLSVPRPQIVTDVDWKEYLEFCEDRVEALALTRIIELDEKYSTFAKRDLGRLPLSKQHRLRQIAYEGSVARMQGRVWPDDAAALLSDSTSYEWLNDDDRKNWRTHLEAVVAVRDQKEVLATSLRLLREAANGNLDSGDLAKVEPEFVEPLRSLNSRVEELFVWKASLIDERAVLDVVKMKLAVEARKLRARKFVRPNS